MNRQDAKGAKEQRPMKGREPGRVVDEPAHLGLAQD